VGKEACARKSVQGSKDFQVWIRVQSCERSQKAGVPQIMRSLRKLYSEI
jgi:hypothetical protein